jgi:hypothetical protein
MDGAARIAEALLTFRFTTSIHVGGLATMPNQIWSRFALAVIKTFIPGGDLKNRQCRFCGPKSPNVMRISAFCFSEYQNFASIVTFFSEAVSNSAFSRNSCAILECQSWVNL